MAWTTPSVRSTGDLITASIWNTDLKDNLRYLKGMDGQVTIEDDIIPNASTLTIGQSANPWGEGDFYALYASPRYAVHRYIREVIFNWEDNDKDRYQLTWGDDGAGAAADMGGWGQVGLKVDDNQAGSKWLHPDDETSPTFGSCLATAFNGSRSPYFRQEFAISQNASNIDVFIGFRQTIGADVPLFNAENFFGLAWNGTAWTFQSADGSSLDSSGSQSISANTRYVIEMLLIAGSGVEAWLNGTLMDTLTVIPTGTMEYTFLLDSDGGGGATDTIATFGKSIMQEDLS